MDSMATTTTTKRKKKLVYRQDPDGVFRLKKENDTDSIHSTSTIERGENVDRLLNELMECSYKVLEPEPPTALKATRVKAKPKQKLITKDLTPAESLPSPTITIPSSAASSRRSSSKSIASSVIDTAMTSPAYSRELEPKLAPEPLDTIDVKTKQVSPLQQKKSVFNIGSKFSHIMASTKKSMVYASDFHTPSYLLGIISTIIAVRYSQLLINLIVGGVIVGGAGIFLAIVIVGLFWYFESLGVLKGYNNTADKVFNKLESFESPQSKSSVIGKEEKPEESRDDDDDKDHSHFDMLAGVQEGEEEDEEDTLSDGQITEHLDEPITMPEPSEEEEKKKRRASQIRVAPFRYDRRHSDYSTGGSFPSLPNLGGTTALDTSRFTAPPLIKRVNTEPLKLHSRRSTSPVKKTLPILPMQAEELPLINEVRLVDSYSDVDREDQKPRKNHDDVGVKRSMSTMSKQSILRTRENYKRFIASAEGDI